MLPLLGLFSPLVLTHSLKSIDFGDTLRLSLNANTIAWGDLGPFVLGSLL